MTPASFTLDGVQPDALPISSRFRVLYPPAEGVPMTESQRGWCVVTFMVVHVRDIRPPYDFHRMYRDDGWERVSAEEASMIRDEGTAVAAGGAV